MYRHASTCLKGPVSRSRVWWQDVTDDREEKEGDSGRQAVRDDCSGEMRLDLIARVRKEIANGTYDTPEKWEAALGRFLHRMDRS